MRTRLLIASLVLIAPSLARAGDFVPGGRRAVQRLLGRHNPAPATVAAAVRAQGFHAGEPIGVAACGGCHADVLAQWQGSAHRFASFNNPYYSAAVLAFRKEKGERASRFCGDCHDPLLTADNTFDRAFDPATAPAQAGLVCLVCHSMTSPGDGRGNGRFTARLDALVLGDGHGARMKPPLLSSPAFCGGCHRVGLTEEITGARWLRGQNDYDAWNDSAIAGHGPGAVRRPAEVKRCQDCHMPQEPALLGDRGAKNGMVRSHRFLGANTALPWLRGDEEQEQRTREFLRGAVTIDLQPGPPGEAAPTLDVVLRNRRVGHRFPGGTMDSNEVWIEVTALDGRGGVLGRSGGLDPRGALDPSAHRVRAQPVDGQGEPIARRDVQHMRGVAYDASLAPADPQCVRYAVPAGAALVRARLLYRKFSRDYLAFACAEVREATVRARCEAAPIVELASAEARLVEGRLVPPASAPATGSGQAPGPGPPPAPGQEIDRLVDHGLALADAVAERAEDAMAPLQRAAALDPQRPEPLLGLARVGLALGQTDQTLALLDRIDALDPGRAGGPLPASLWLRATTLHRAYRDGPALRVAEQLRLRLPGDRNVAGLVARLRGVAGDAQGSLAAADEALAIDPEHEEGLYQRLLSLRELGRDATAVEVAYLRHRREVEVDLDLRRRFAAAHPELADESVPLHVHSLR